MRREPHVRFCEHVVVRSRRATHLVVLVAGSREDALSEKDALAVFLSVRPETVRVI